MPSKRVTSFDVAKNAGVSRTTVSLVLNNVPGINIREATRQRVFAGGERSKLSSGFQGEKTGKRKIKYDRIGASTEP